MPREAELHVFVQHARVPPDSNAAERRTCGPVSTRFTCLGPGSAAATPDRANGLALRHAAHGEPGSVLPNVGLSQRADTRNGWPTWGHGAWPRRYVPAAARAKHLRRRTRRSIGSTLRTRRRTPLRSSPGITTPPLASGSLRGITDCAP